MYKENEGNFWDNVISEVSLSDDDSVVDTKSLTFLARG